MASFRTVNYGRSRTPELPDLGACISAATRALQHSGRVSECEHLPAGCGVLSAGARGLLAGALLVSQSCCRRAKSQSFTPGGADRCSPCSW